MTKGEGLHATVAKFTPYKGVLVRVYAEPRRSADGTWEWCPAWKLPPADGSRGNSTLHRLASRYASPTSALEAAWHRAIEAVDAAAQRSCTPGD